MEGEISRQNCTWQSDQTAIRQNHAACITREMTALKARIDRLNTAFTEGGIDLAEFKEMKNPLVAQKVDLEQKMRQALGKGASRLELLRNWILEANTGEELVSDEDLLEMKSFLQKVGSNRLLRSQTLTVSFKKPLGLLANTTVAVQTTLLPNLNDLHYGGAEGSRTPDLLIANETLYQLSYDPIQLTYN